MDGLKCHVGASLRAYCSEHKVHILTLPPHTSHVSQPLDVSIFNVLKSTIRNPATEYIIKPISDLPIKSAATHDRCIQIAKALVAHQEACTPQRIKKAFLETGIYPPSIDHFLYYQNKVLSVPEDVKRRATEAVKAELAMEMEKITSTTRESVVAHKSVS